MDNNRKMAEGGGGGGGGGGGLKHVQWDPNIRSLLLQRFEIFRPNEGFLSCLNGGFLLL